MRIVNDITVINISAIEPYGMINAESKTNREIAQPAPKENMSPVTDEIKPSVKYSTAII
jgi:hypothetical protein